MQCDEITHTNIENGPLMGGPELFEHKAIIGLKDYGFLPCASSQSTYMWW